MPIFDFQCKQCDHVFETLVLGSTAPVCPECGSRNLEKQVSRPAPQGKTAQGLARARAQAVSEGHFSNYAASERPTRK